MQRSPLAAAVLAAGLAVPLMTAAPAQARDGCGPGFHRGYYGWCRPNLGPRPFVYRPAFYRPYGLHRWGGGWGYRRFGWHRWGGGWGYRHVGWHHRWGRRW